jgi:hypothetical protein
MSGALEHEMMGQGCGIATTEHIDYILLHVGIQTSIALQKTAINTNEPTAAW